MRATGLNVPLTPSDERARRRGRFVVATLLVALPIVKWMQIEHYPDHEVARQILLATVLAATALWVVGQRALVSAIKTPAGAATIRRPRTRQRWLHPALALSAAAAAVGSAVAVLSAEPRRLVAALLAASLLLVAVLGIDVCRRFRHTEDRKSASMAIWTVAPAIVLWAVLIEFGLVENAFNTLAEPTLLMAGSAGSALYTAVVIGVGEEYLFRGLLFVLAVATGHDRMGFLTVNLSFAAWHLPDVWAEGIGLVALTMVAMFVASFVFFVIRRRSGNLAGPALLHAANNVGFSLVA